PPVALSRPPASTGAAELPPEPGTAVFPPDPAALSSRPCSILSPPPHASAHNAQSKVQVQRRASKRAGIRPPAPIYFGTLSCIQVVMRCAVASPVFGRQD